MRDEELEKLIAQTAAKKSETTPDASFAQALNFKLHQEISKLSNQKQNQAINYNFMKNFKFVFPAAVIAIVALVFVTLPRKQQKLVLPGKQQITRTSANAFGSLATLTVAGRGQGGGGGGMGSDAAMPAPAESTKMAVPPSDSMIYQPVNYKFVYKGEDFTVDSDKMAVYEREKGFGQVSLSSILQNFSIGSFDINRFANARLDYLTASQDQNQGYMLNIDLREGAINIGQNWEKWPNPLAQCVDQACYDQYKLNLDQVPADENIIALANQFLDEYGIDRSAYGTPEVQNQWRIQYEAMSDKRFAYVPDFASVIYPTKIEGHEIYDQSGNKSGMYVSVDIRNNKVSGVGELTSQRYQSSDYETVTDPKAILAVAEKGGYQSYYPFEQSGAKTVEVDLGTPMVSYVRLWQVIDGKTKDLYVPSMIFPILNTPQEIYTRNVVVPLVKEVLNAKQPPFPVMEKSVR